MLVAVTPWVPPPVPPLLLLEEPQAATTAASAAIAAADRTRVLMGPPPLGREPPPEISRTGKDGHFHRVMHAGSRRQGAWPDARRAIASGCVRRCDPAPGCHPEYRWARPAWLRSA